MPTGTNKKLHPRSLSLAKGPGAGEPSKTRNFWTRTALLQQHTENLPPPPACNVCPESRHLPSRWRQAPDTPQQGGVREASTFIVALGNLYTHFSLGLLETCYKCFDSRLNISNDVFFINNVGMKL